MEVYNTLPHHEVGLNKVLSVAYNVVIKGKSAIAIAANWIEEGISQEKVSGLADILCQRLGWTRRWSERISEIRRRKMNAMIS
jgi:hypothetical protein